MKILVLGSYYSPNLGDGVICECVADRLRVHLPDAEITIGDVLGRTDWCDPEQVQIKQLRDIRRHVQWRRWAYKLLHWDKQLQHEEYRLSKIKQRLDQLGSAPVDLVVFAGGQMFMDDYALMLEHCVKLFSQRKIPMIFNACGTGPAYSENVRLKLKNALENPWVKLVSSRDDVQLVDERYFQEQRTVKTFDPALWCAEVYGIERNPNADTVGLGVMFARSVAPDRMIRFWICMIRHLEQRNIKWKIFTNGDPGDYCMADEILSRMPEFAGRKAQYIVMMPARPCELVKTLSQFKSLISFRLHSHIIAASLGIPTVAMVWDNKLKFFFEQIGQPERCCTVLQSPMEIVRILEKAESEGYDARRLMKQKQYADELLRDSIIKVEKDIYESNK